MNHQILIASVLLSLLISCKNSSSIEEEKTKPLILELKETQNKLSELQSNHAGEIIHEVYLDLKPDQKIDMVIEEIKKLSNIEVVKNLKVGAFKNLNDARAMDTYEVKFQMRFDSEKNYKTYQNHSIHLLLKDKLKPILIGPPVTYDFTIW